MGLRLRLSLRLWLLVLGVCLIHWENCSGAVVKGSRCARLGLGAGAVQSLGSGHWHY